MKRIDGEGYYDSKNLEEQKKAYNESCRKELFDCQLSNFLWNMPLIQSLRYPGILGFEGLFKKVPAIVVGAGPSLDKTGELLKKYRDNFLIVACDAALPVLVKKYKVYPHFVVMVDPTAKQKNNFNDIDTSKFYTMIPPVVHPNIFRTVNPKTLAVYNLKDTKNSIFEQAPYHIGKRGALPSAVLTSGACYAFSGAMKCDPIIFVGQDLSWASTEKIYASGISKWKVNFQKGAKFKSNCMLFPDINGKLVLTHQTLLMFWSWLKDNHKPANHKLINSSGAGILKFKGIKIMDFDKAIKKYANKKLVDVDKKILKAYNYETSDGLIEKLLLPDFKKKYADLYYRATGIKKEK